MIADEWTRHRGLTITYSIFFGIIALLLYASIIRVLLRRWGVDDQKVWTKFGPFRYREVRFDQMTRLSIGPDTYNLHSGDIMITLKYNRFDYSLAYIQLAKELRKRRFKIIDTDPNYHTWDDQARIWRQIFCEYALQKHYAYFQAHPSQATDLLNLIPTSTHQPPKPTAHKTT